MTTTIEDTTTGPSEMTGFDPHALEAFMHHAGGQATAAVNAALVGLGDRLGLWKALADGRPATAAELATRTGVAQRYLEEWLAAQAANGFITYDAATGVLQVDARGGDGPRRRGQPGTDDRRFSGRGGAGAVAANARTSVPHRRRHRLA